MTERAAIDLEMIRRSYSAAGPVTKGVIAEQLIVEVEVLRERVVKLNGWLTEHESRLAKSRRETNDARREVEALRERVAELEEKLARSEYWEGKLRQVAGYDIHEVFDRAETAEARGTELTRALKDFQEHVINNVTQWRGGTGSHQHPIWGQVSDALTAMPAEEPTP